MTWKPFNFAFKRATVGLAAGVIVLTCLRLWMTSAQAIFLAGGAYDDLLFVRLASGLPAHWLGPYNSLTLIKGPGYPIWIAFTSHLHIPLFFAQHLLYAIACIVLLVALRPLVRQPVLLLGVYALVLMNPVMMGPTNWFVFREGIYSSQCVLIAAGLLGVATTTRRARPIRWAWAIVTGWALAAALITREEGIWLAPLVAGVLIPLVLMLWFRRRQTHKLAWLVIPGRPLAIAWALVLLICTLNYFYYGEFLVTETMNRPFISAIGAMERVDPPHFRQFVPVTHETRRELYAVSPAFAKLRPQLEEIAVYWGHTELRYPQLRDSGEIGAAFWIWAVRAAAAHISIYKNARTAERYYQQVADQINAAVDSGRLKGGPRRDTLVPPWRKEYGPLLISAAPQALDDLVSFRIQPPIPQANRSPGAPALHKMYREITRTHILPTDPAAAERAAVARSNDPRMLVVTAIFHGYRGCTRWLALAAGMAIVALIAIPMLRRRRAWLIVLVLSVAASIAARTAMLLYMGVTSFGARNPGYVGPGQTLLLLAISVALAAVLSSVWRWLKIKRRQRLSTHLNAPASV